MLYDRWAVGHRNWKNLGVEDDIQVVGWWSVTHWCVKESS